MKKLITNKILQIIIILMSLATCISLVIFSPNKVNNSLDKNSKPWTNTLETLNDLGDNSIKLPGYNNISLPSNTKNVQLTLLNPEGNECYFKFKLLIDDEIIYTSELVQSGYAIDEVDLNRSLDKGDYNLTINITPYALDKTTKLNGANIKASLNVY